MTADLIFALEAAKYASREVYGVRRVSTKEDELFKLLNKQMILQVLSDDSCLEELTATEQTTLSGMLTLKS
jgi:hypothetical protein